VVINEIMYAPPPPEPEWAELYNAGPDPADLSGWTLRDEGGAETTITATILPPRSFLVITRDTARLAEIRHIPSPILQLSLPLLNNGGDGLVLRDPSGRRIDSVRFSASWGGSSGGSIERRSAGDPGSRPSSWGPCVDPDSATPGRTNSISAAGLDIAITSARFDRAGSRAIAVVANPGLGESLPATATLYRDADGDGSGAPEEELARATVGTLRPGDSATIELGWRVALAERGEPGLIVLAMPGDERPGNNSAEFIAQAPLLDTGVVINEIMFDPMPLGATTGAEYIELYNRNDAQVWIAGWKIYDATRKAQVAIPATIPPIPQRSYYLIASDSGIYARFPGLADSTNVTVMGVSGFSLNADEDDVVLRNNAGATVDSVHYHDDWHRRELGGTRGMALERISPSAPSGDGRNWSTSAGIGGGTPGAINSLAIAPGRSDATLGVAPSTVSPDGDGFEDFIRVSYRLPARTARIVADVHDRWGRRVRRIASNEPAAATGELIWDGRDDDGRPLTPGIYIIRIEAYDDGGGGLSTAQGTVVVAKKL